MIESKPSPQDSRVTNAKLLTLKKSKSHKLGETVWLRFFFFLVYKIETMGPHTPPNEIVLEIARELYNSLYVGCFLKRKLVPGNTLILHPIQIDSIFYSSSKLYCEKPSCSFLPRKDKRIFQILIDRGSPSFIGRGIVTKREKTSTMHPLCSSYLETSIQSVSSIRKATTCPAPPHKRAIKASCEPYQLTGGRKSKR